MRTRTVAQREPSKSKQPKDRFAHLSDEERAALKELAEVERAIAVLEGRSDTSPEDVAFARKEAERLRQQVGAAVEKTEENVRAVRRARLTRAAGVVACLGALAGAAAVVIPPARAWLDARERAGAAARRAAETFLREGFAEIEVTEGIEPRVVTGERGRCFIAVAGSADGPARVRLERGPISLEGASAGFCACGPEPVRITPDGVEPVELRLLGAPASLMGGADLLGVLPVPPEARVPEAVDRACAEEAIDAFVAEHPPDAIGEDESAGLEAIGAASNDRMQSAGLRWAASAPPAMPLLVLPPSKDACLLVLSDASEDLLSLRLRGGERPIEGHRGAIALCGRSIEGASVWRSGIGTLSAYAALAERVGGLLGMRELSAHLGEKVALWIASADLAFDANAALLASGLAPSRPDDPADPARAAASPFVSLVAISTDARSLLAVDDAAPGALCSPPVRIGVARAMCLETRSGAIAGPADLPDGAARAKRPLWLPIAPGDRAQQRRVLDVLSLSRRLSAAGFDLTTLTGFVEVPGGVEITGRSGEDEVVAISLSATPPYVHTLTDGPRWTIEGPANAESRPTSIEGPANAESRPASIDGEPRAVPLSAGKTVRLRPYPPFRGPRAGRETLVWRR